MVSKAASRWIRRYVNTLTAWQLRNGGFGPDFKKMAKEIGAQYHW